jgi:hypothetical protein
VACEFIYIAGTIEKRVIGVKMKVGELCCHASILRRLYRPLREDKGGQNSSGFLLNYKYFCVMRLLLAERRCLLWEAAQGGSKNAFYWGGSVSGVLWCYRR